MLLAPQRRLRLRERPGEVLRRDDEPELPVLSATMALIPCPDCGTQVSDAAITCPKCARPIAPAAQAPVQQQWSPGVAAVLSLVIPGAGQMYKGQVGNGLAWLLVVVLGYVFFVVPGLILHLCCIVGAASGGAKSGRS